MNYNSTLKDLRKILKKEIKNCPFIYMVDGKLESWIDEILNGYKGMENKPVGCEWVTEGFKNDLTPCNRLIDFYFLYD